MKILPMKKSREKENGKRDEDSGKKIDWRKKWDQTKEIVGKTVTTGNSVLQGVVGDHLEKLDWNIALQMQFYRGGSPLSIDKTLLKKTPNVSSKIVVLVHGLVSDETFWKLPEEKEDYGSLLEKETGRSPFYIRYNTGLHISDNGQTLDALLTRLWENYPVAIKEISFVCHSMGGLVVRSACHYGEKNKSKWISKTKKIVFIGSPHHGAGLEKFGNLVTNVLEKIPNPFTYLTGKAINLRSAGIKDLRYGYLVEEDWKGKDPDSFLTSPKTHVPLLKNTDYYVITGTLTSNPEHVLAEILGDAIVGKWSSQGKSGDSKYDLSFPEKNQKEFPGITHITLMHDRKVYEQIKKWLT